MKLGQIIKMTPEGLKSFPPGVRNYIKDRIGLVVREKYDLSYLLDRDKLPERVRVYPALVRFDGLDEILHEHDEIMFFPNQAEILS